MQAYSTKDMYDVFSSYTCQFTNSRLRYVHVQVLQLQTFSC